MTIINFPYRADQVGGPTYEALARLSVDNGYVLGDPPAPTLAGRPSPLTMTPVFFYLPHGVGDVLQANTAKARQLMDDRQFRLDIGAPISRASGWFRAVDFWLKSAVDSVDTGADEIADKVLRAFRVTHPGFEGGPETRQ